MSLVDIIKRAKRSASRPTGVELEQECFRLAKENDLSTEVVSLLCVSRGRDKNLEEMRGPLVQLDMLLRGLQQAGKTLDDTDINSRREFDHLNRATSWADWDTRSRALTERLILKMSVGS